MALNGVEKKISENYQVWTLNANLIKNQPQFLSPFLLGDLYDPEPELDSLLKDMNAFEDLYTSPPNYDNAPLTEAPPSLPHSGNHGNRRASPNTAPSLHQTPGTLESRSVLEYEGLCCSECLVF